MPRAESDVASAAKGDRGAFARLIGQYGGLVAAITLATTGEVAASEDIAQDVFVEAWQTLPRLRARASFGSWLSSIARHKAADELRRRQRRHSLDPAAVQAAADPSTAVLDSLIRAEDAARVARALQGLSAADREALVLFYQEGRSIAMVAERLGISETAAKTRLSRARARLRDELEDAVAAAVASFVPTPDFAARVLRELPAQLPPPGLLPVAGWVGAAAGVVATVAILASQPTPANPAAPVASTLPVSIQRIRSAAPQGISQTMTTGVTGGRQQPQAQAFAPAGFQPRLDVPALADSILLDGVIDEPDWRRAGRTGVFTVPGEEEPQRPYSEARFLHDGTMLYVGLFAAAEEVQSADTFNLEFISPQDGSTVRMSISAGGRFTEGRTAGASPAPGWGSGVRLKVYADERYERDEWSVEVAIPLSSLGVDPESTREFQASVNRCLPAVLGRSRCGKWGGGGEWATDGILRLLP